METNVAKICAVVVTYNRKDLLRVCLEALKSQTRELDSILVVDNASSDGTEEMLSEEFLSVKVISLKSNTGGAGGFYSGIRKAHEDGYDMFWLMDDDAEPSKNALEMLLSEPTAFQEDVVCLSGAVMDRSGAIAVNHRGYLNDPDKIILGWIQRPVPEELYKKRVVEIDTVSFVGPLIKREVVTRIGYPMREFFVHNDDIEYSMRLRKAGKVLLIGASTIRHFEAFTQSENGKPFTRRFPEYGKLWLYYYGKRNLCYIAKRERKSFSFFILFFIKRLVLEIKTSIGLLLRADHRIRRIFLPYMAMFNGLRGNFDNTVPRRWLY